MKSVKLKKGIFQWSNGHLGISLPPKPHPYIYIAGNSQSQVNKVSFSFLKFTKGEAPTNIQILFTPNIGPGQHGCNHKD